MRFALRLIALATLAFVGSTHAVEPTKTNSTSTSSDVKSTDVNNSAINKRDQNSKTLTPQDQPNNEVDRDTLANVRQAITGDKSLSTDAHNVKILVSDHVVTLRGPVDSRQEKTKIGKIATDVKGVSTVHNELEVKSK